MLAILARTPAFSLQDRMLLKPDCVLTGVKLGLTQSRGLSCVFVPGPKFQIGFQLSMPPSAQREFETPQKKLY